jgi:hypothetical protein
MFQTAINWLGQSAVSAGIVLILGYLFRNLIETRLKVSVQHEFDQKLQSFKSQLEEEVRQRESMRSTALSALLSQRSALAMKRVEAAQGLWNGIRELKKGSGLAMQLDILNLDEVVKELNNPKMQTALRAIAPPSVTSDEYLANLNQFETHRPFVSPTAWALYAAYTSIIVFYVSNMKMLQIGYDFRKFLKVQHWTALLGTTLPMDEVSQIYSGPEHGIQWALGRLEERFIEELQRSISEESAGVDSLGTARRILDEADKLKASAAEALSRVQQGGDK